jgi:hypothetical protein
VNLDTNHLAPEESIQFGRALWRILQHISDGDPRLGPIHLSKIDIDDGFYRIWIDADDVPKLGVMFPKAPGEELLVGFPLVLQMGWIQPWRRKKMHRLSTGLLKTKWKRGASQVHTHLTYFKNQVF